VLRALKTLVRPGDVAYDIGANVGLFSTSLARLVGDTGWLYAFEPNPVCVSFLRANLSKAGARRFTILPMAVSDRQCECPFTVNYASTFIGATADSPATIAKLGQTIRVDADRLDALIAAWRLPPPHFMKIDIEGAEQIAIDGMLATLAAHRPTILIELHGRGPAQRTLGKLDAQGYRYSLPGSGATFQSAVELLDWMPEACIQVIAHPLPARNG
jgi:FkbM family methyltransferase